MATFDLAVLDGLSDEALRRIVKRLSVTEKAALWNAIANTPPTDPRERLFWFVHREQSVRLMARLNKLPVRELGAAVLRLTAGDDLERILNELPTPVSDDITDAHHRQLETPEHTLGSSSSLLRHC